MPRVGTSVWTVARLALGLVGAPAAAQDTLRLSLEEALRRADAASEAVGAAQAQAQRAAADVGRARSAFWPQVSATASYTRTLRSEFQSLRLGGGPPPDTSLQCGRFTPDPSRPLGERVDSLEKAIRCLQSFNPLSGLRNLPFGRENIYNLGLSAQHVLFAGGRLRAQVAAAKEGEATAELAVQQARAQARLEVLQAYADAQLADRLVAIAAASLEQAERTLRQASLGRRVGTQPEFEELRARVARDNLRPQLVQAEAQRMAAHLRLKQLLDLPATTELVLTTSLEGDTTLPGALPLATDAPPPGARARAAVAQAERLVRVREAQLRIARAQRWPTLALATQYARVAYPSDLVPNGGDFRTNWTVTLALQWTPFTGGRLRQDVRAAEADLAEARERLSQAEELAALEARVAEAQLAAAEATWAAAAGTVEQAERAYTIAEVRYREGISTQLELADARLLLQQARLNRARAARDLALARARVALLPWLPLGAVLGSGSATAGAGGPSVTSTAVLPAAPTASGVGGVGATSLGSTRFGTIGGGNP